MRPAGRPWAPLVFAALPCTAALVVLALAGASDLAVALGLVAVAAVGAVILRRYLPVFGRPVGALPLLAALGYLAGIGPIGPATEAVAGVAGVGLLVWVALSDPEPARPSGVVGGVVVPALGLGIALAVSLFLPVARQSVGIAAALLAIALGVLAGAILWNAPEPDGPQAVPPSL